MTLPPLTLRSVKGSPLTISEHDGNHERHEARITALEENPAAAKEIVNITLLGTQLTFHFDDGSSIGPLTVPRSPFIPAVAKNITGEGGFYSPVIGDANGYLRYAGNEPLTVLVPAESAVPFLVNTEITFVQAGFGQIAIEAPSDVTVTDTPGYLHATAQQGATIVVKKVGPDQWDVVGWLAPDESA